eukprot:jgi/Psemu1/36130/gm1.36130_g
MPEPAINWNEVRGIHFSFGHHFGCDNKQGKLNAAFAQILPNIASLFILDEECSLIVAAIVDELPASELIEQLKREQNGDTLQQVIPPKRKRPQTTRPATGGLNPIKPIESEVEPTIKVPSSCVTSPSATTDLIPNRMLDFDVVATPSNTTASFPPAVTANLGPLQTVGPIADTPSVKAPHYIWTWTYSPHSESVSFHRVRSDSFLRATSSRPPVQCQEKSSIVTAPSVSPSAQTRFGHHSTPPCEPANLRWTFNPQIEIATFRRLTKSVPPPSPLLISDVLDAGTDPPNAASAYI